MEQVKNNNTGNVNIHRLDIDIIKAVSIIAVVLYHVYGDSCSTGYLGVDAFFVVNGFFIIPGIYRAINDDRFGYFKFIIKRVSRMLPVLVIACMAVLLVALIGMVPDDLLTVAESAVASLFFSNNLLSLYLCADYWDWTNEFKPLMHTWYLGVLMEMYIIVPIVLMVFSFVAKKAKADKKKAQLIALWVMFCTSLAFFIGCKRTELNFYLVFGRIYEFVAGGLIALYLGRRRDTSTDVEKNAKATGKAYNQLYQKVGFGIAFLILLAVLFCGVTSISLNNKIAIIITVVCTLVCIVCGSAFASTDNKAVIAIGVVGKASFSIYIWHQILLAFYRYFYSCRMDMMFWVVYGVSLGIIATLSYAFIEKKIKLDNKKNWLICIAVFATVNICCLFVWSKSGVLYSIPELDVNKAKIDKRKNAHYVDRIYDMDVAFDEDDRLKVLVIGNSFARDFANIILESDYAEYVDLTYSFSEPRDEKRIQESDIIFVYGKPDSLTEFFWNNAGDRAKVFGIGTKNFGECIGQYYLHRFSDRYYEQSGIIQDKVAVQEIELAIAWGDQYIDIIGPLLKEDGSIRVFTDDNKYISYDMHHLTKAGAVYIGKMIDISSLLEAID